jgi:hypothetical protein
VGTAENEVTLRRYITAMDDADYPAALTAFSDDAVYIHPPLPPPGAAIGQMGPPGSVVLRGRREVAVLFEQRGVYPTSHDLHTMVSAGDEVFVEGTVTLAGGTTVAILLHATFDEDGRISRYIALK